LREFLEALETTFVPSGYRLLQEGKDAGAAYIVATGSLEISRRSPDGATKPRTVLGRVGSGALVGEVALMSHLPSAASVTATTASILLVARRSAVEPVAARHAELGIELAAFCRRHAVANLGWASTLVAAVPATECASLVERLETRTFQRGEKLVAHGEEAQGLHLIVSGEVAVVAREGGGRVMLATRIAGETVGEVELVLCQRANVDAIAVRSTATLLLPPEEFFALVRESPATLHGLYAIAVRRHAELRHALDAGSARSGEEWMLDESSGESLPHAEGSGPNQLGEGLPARQTPPPPLPREATPPTPTPPPVGRMYEPLNGVAFRESAGRTGSAGPSPFAPAASFAPTQYGGSAADAHTAVAPPAPSQAPASFIPPAPAAAPSPLASAQPSSYPPPSPFVPPLGAAQSRHSNGSMAPSAATLAAAPRSWGGPMMVLAAITTAISVVLLTATLLGRRPSDLLGPAPAAVRQGAGDITPPSGESVVATTPTPQAAAPVAAPAATRAPIVIPISKVSKVHTPVARSSESTASSQGDGASASSSTPSSSAVATSAATTPATAPAPPVSTPASATSDDFGGRQ